MKRSICIMFPILIASLIACQQNQSTVNQAPDPNSINTEVGPAMMTIKTEDGRSGKGFIILVEVKPEIKGLGGFFLFFITTAEMLDTNKSDYITVVFDNFKPENYPDAEMHILSGKTLLKYNIGILDLFKPHILKGFPAKLGSKNLLRYNDIMDDSVDFNELKTALGLVPDATKQAITEVLKLSISKMHESNQEILQFP